MKKVGTLDVGKYGFGMDFSNTFIEGLHGRYLLYANLYKGDAVEEDSAKTNARLIERLEALLEEYREYDCDNEWEFSTPYIEALHKKRKEILDCLFIEMKAKYLDILTLAREKIQDQVNEIYSSGGVDHLGLGPALDKIDKVLEE